MGRVNACTIFPPEYTSLKRCSHSYSGSADFSSVWRLWQQGRVGMETQEERVCRLQRKSGSIETSAAHEEGVCRLQQHRNFSRTRTSAAKLLLQQNFFCSKKKIILQHGELLLRELLLRQLLQQQRKGTSSEATSSAAQEGNFF